MVRKISIEIWNYVFVLFSFQRIYRPIKCTCSMREAKRHHWSVPLANTFLTPDFFKRALLNYWGVSNQSQTGMDERPIWVHKFSRKKQIPHGSIHPLPQHILLVKFRTVKTKMIIKSSFFFQKFSSIGT